MQPVEGMWPHQRVHLSFGRHASHNRQMVARLPLVHDWRLAPRAVGLDHPRQEVEARFVHENEGPVFAAGLLLQNWPRFDPPPLDGFFVPLIARVIGTCGVHPRCLSRRDTWLLLYETPNSW